MTTDNNPMNLTNTTAHNATEDECHEPVPVTTVRFLLLVGFCTPIAVVGMIMNMIILAFFCAKKRRREASLYLGVLAVLDVTMCGSYLLIMSTDAFALYWRLEWMWIAWHAYVVPMFMVSRVSELSSAWILVFASFDRLITSLSKGARRNRMIRPFASLITHEGRVKLITLVMLYSVLFCLITLWEYEVVRTQQCYDQPFTWMTVTLANRMVNSDAFHIWDWYIYPSFLIFLPFTVLVLCNVLILCVFRSRSRSRHTTEHIFETDVSHNRQYLKPSVNVVAFTLYCASQLFTRRITAFRLAREEHKRVRNITSTLLEIISTYLVCTSFALFVKVLERMPVQNNPLLWVDEDTPTDFYTLSTDIISFLVMLNSSLRPFIYMSSDQQLRMYVCGKGAKLDRQVAVRRRTVKTTHKQYMEAGVRDTVTTSSSSDYGRCNAAESTPLASTQIVELNGKTAHFNNYAVRREKRLCDYDFPQEVLL